MIAKSQLIIGGWSKTGRLGFLKTFDWHKKEYLNIRQVRAYQSGFFVLVPINRN